MKSTYCVIVTLFLLASLGISQAKESKTEKVDAKRIASEIDSLLYSNLSKEEILDKLKPYVAVMDSIIEFEKKSGLKLKDGFGSGPGVMHYMLSECGLQLVVDPDQIIRIIRRSHKVINGTDYAEISISEPGFLWNGYARRYPN